MKLLLSLCILALSTNVFAANKIKNGDFACVDMKVSIDKKGITFEEGGFSEKYLFDDGEITSWVKLDKKSAVKVFKNEDGSYLISAYTSDGSFDKIYLRPDPEKTSELLSVTMSSFSMLFSGKVDAYSPEVIDGCKRIPKK